MSFHFMATHKAAAIAALVAAGAAAWAVRGLLLVEPATSGGARIVAGGLRIYLHLWPVLIAAGAASLAILGAQAARAAVTGTRADLASDIRAADQERQQLDQERQQLEDQGRAFDTARRNGEAEIRRAQAVLDADRRGLTKLLDRQRQEIGRLQGELSGARQHIKRIKRRRE